MIATGSAGFLPLFATALLVVFHKPQYMPSIFVESATTPVAARVSFIRDKRDTVRKFTRSLLEGIYVYKTQKEFSKKVIAKYVKTNDNDALEDSYQFFSRLVPIKPYPSLDAIKEALLELGEKDPKARAAKPERQNTAQSNLKLRRR